MGIVMLPQNLAQVMELAWGQVMALAAVALVQDMALKVVIWVRVWVLVVVVAMV